MLHSELEDNPRGKEFRLRAKRMSKCGSVDKDGYDS